MTHDTGYRKTSLIDEDWEELDIKPPVDLIPDEFKRESNKKILVEIVLSQRDPEAIDFKDFMISLDYVVSETYYDGKGIDKTPPGTQWLTQVQNKILTSEFEGLIMVFAKVSYKSEDMKKIWSMFTAPNCPTLKDKPKIFLFQLLKRIVQFDAAIMRKTWSAKYDTPAEADIAVIYDKYDPDQAEDMLNILTENIKMYGYNEDLINLIAIGSGLHYRPMTISTMTKKFFFKKHELRGHVYNVIEKQNITKEKIAKIKAKFQQPPPVAEAKSKVKKGSSFSFTAFKKSKAGTEVNATTPMPIKRIAGDPVNKNLGSSSRTSSNLKESALEVKPPAVLPAGTSDRVKRRPPRTGVSDDKTRISRHLSTVSSNSSTSSLNAKMTNKKPVWKP